MIKIEILGDDLDAITRDIEELHERLNGIAPAPLPRTLGEMIEETQKVAEEAGFKVEITAPDAETHENVIEMPQKAKRRSKAKAEEVVEETPAEEPEPVEEDLNAFKEHWLPIMQKSCFEQGGADAVNYLRKKFKIRSFTETPAEMFPEIVAAYQEKMNGAR